MTESAAVQLRALRAAIASGQVEATDWDSELIEETSIELFMAVYRELHPNENMCRCNDREYVLAGLDRLIAETEAQEAKP